MTMHITFRRERLSDSDQAVVAAGFHAHADEQSAPQYRKEHAHWTVTDDNDATLAVLTSDILWDWLYIDELWVSPDRRGSGLGRQLIEEAEVFARKEGLQGIWLWTQSWQAEGFYTELGYEEFTRFDHFPRGYSRIGFRKTLS